MAPAFSSLLGPLVTSDDKNIKQTPLQKKRAASRSKTPVYTSSYFNMLYTNSQTPAQSQTVDLAHLPLSTTAPIPLASQCITAQIDKDNDTPTLYEILSKYAIDNYNFNSKESLGPFTRFEKQAFYSLPDKLFQFNELKNQKEILITGMGILPGLQRAWLSFKNKLYIWNYDASVIDQEFDIVDEFNGDIITCALVPPKKGVFVESVNYLLLVSTSTEIKILALEFDKTTKKLEIADSKLSVPTNGLIVSRFVCYEKTGDIFFTGDGTGFDIWGLNYTNSKDWFSKSCSKECITNSYLLPGVLGWLGTDSSTNAEKIIDLTIDQERKILYTLSSKSVIRAYVINDKSGKSSLGRCIVKNVNHIIRDLSTTPTVPINIHSKLLNRNNLKLIKIASVSKMEDSNLYLVVVASNGCRFYIKGSSYYDGRVALNTAHVKFPPMDLATAEMIEKRKEKMVDGDTMYQNLMSQNQPTTTATQNPLATSMFGMGRPTPASIMASTLSASASTSTQASLSTQKSITKAQTPVIISLQELKQAQESSDLLNNTQKALVVSPGILFGFSENRGLYTLTPDYGSLKKSSQYIEDFETVEKFSNVYSIVQLTSSFNATDKPKGYANAFASQYTSDPLEIAVLTQSGIHIYRYRTPDLILENSLDEKTFNQFALKYGSDEACSTALYLACIFGKSDSFKNLATKFFISGGQKAKLNKNLPPVTDSVEPSDRFYAVLLIFSRLMRKIWKKEVFALDPEIKFTKDGYIDQKSVKQIENKWIISGLNISSEELEFLLCSILILIKFFEDNKKIIPGLKSSDLGFKTNEQELCHQAEMICFTAITRFFNRVKEGLSFLGLLANGLEQTVSHLSIQSQADLSCITFVDFFTTGSNQDTDDEKTKLIKDLLSAFINKSIEQGQNVETIASTLQKKCGSFCSTGDVLIFKAFEKLRAAKSLHESSKGTLPNQVNQFLKDAVALLKQAELNDEIITDCVNIILILERFELAVKFILDVANGEVIKREVWEAAVVNVDKAHQRKEGLYALIFQILSSLDARALVAKSQAGDVTIISGSLPIGSTLKNGEVITYEEQTRSSCHKICLEYPDAYFHTKYYDWCVINGASKKLLEIDTPYVLNYLETKSKENNGKNMNELLWVYYSKRGKFLEAANVLYSLSSNTSEIKLGDRIGYLSMATNFMQSIEPQLISTKHLELSQQINDLLKVANIQDELVHIISQDSRINDKARKIANDSLTAEIKTLNALYNEWIDPLGYWELCLICFKVGEYWSKDAVINKWSSIIQKWKFLYSEESAILTQFISLAERVKDVDALLPLVEIIEILVKEISQVGLISDALINCGLEYRRVYCALRDLICTCNDIRLKNEMIYLMKKWYGVDRKLRELVAPEKVSQLKNYDAENDPIWLFVSKGL